NKPNDDNEYAEEMLMMCVYWNALMFPETNIDLIIKHFETRRFGGYLKCAYVIEEGKYKEKPGFQTGTKDSDKGLLISLTRTHIRNHVLRENHIEIIEQWLAIKKKEDMTKLDLFVCAAGCLLGQRNTFRPDQFFIPKDEYEKL